MVSRTSETRYKYKVYRKGMIYLIMLKCTTFVPINHITDKDNGQPKTGRKYL